MSVPKAILVRFTLSMVVGLLVAFVVTEIGFRLEGNTISRAPKTVILVIPNGTSANVAQGLDLIPSDMAFMLGDTLQIRNQDSVTHSLGPMVIPAGSTASLELNEAKNLAYTCSFETHKVFGIDVHQGLTTGTRIEGILLAGVPLGAMLTVYTFVFWPYKPKKKNQEA